MRGRERTAQTWGEQAYQLFLEAGGNMNDLTLRELSWVGFYVEELINKLPEGQERDEKMKIDEQVTRELDARNHEIVEQGIDINSIHVPKRYDQIHGRLE